jgi:hypothetical protein
MHLASSFARVCVQLGELIIAVVALIRPKFSSLTNQLPNHSCFLGLVQVLNSCLKTVATVITHSISFECSACIDQSC